MDFKFKCESPGRKLTDYTARDAILPALLPRKDVFAKDADRSALLERVLKIWRLKVQQFRQLGWNETIKSHFQYLRNCSPAMGKWECNRTSRRCRRFHICPWCWARSRCYDTVSTFRNVLRLLSIPIPKQGESTSLLSGFDLEMTRDFALRSPEDPIVWYKLLHGSLKEAWRKTLKPLGCLGVIAQGFYEPAMAGPQVKETCRFIGITKPEAIPFIEEHGGKVWAFSKRGLSRGVSRFGRYPAGLFRHQPELAVLLLNAKRRSQLMFQFGHMRYWQGELGKKWTAMKEEREKKEKEHTAIRLRELGQIDRRADDTQHGGG